jgi:hypothetical protein
MENFEHVNVDSFNEDLYIHLEFHLGKTFFNSPHDEIRNLWCDGILPLSAVQLTKKNINDTRKITATAFIGSMVKMNMQ